MLHLPSGMALDSMCYNSYQKAALTETVTGRLLLFAVLFVFPLEVSVLDTISSIDRFNVDYSSYDPASNPDEYNYFCNKYGRVPLFGYYHNGSRDREEDISLWDLEREGKFRALISRGKETTLIKFVDTSNGENIYYITYLNYEIYLNRFSGPMKYTDSFFGDTIEFECKYRSAKKGDENKSDDDEIDEEPLTYRDFLIDLLIGHISYFCLSQDEAAKDRIEDIIESLYPEYFDRDDDDDGDDDEKLRQALMLFAKFILKIDIDEDATIEVIAEKVRSHEKPTKNKRAKSKRPETATDYSKTWKKLSDAIKADIKKYEEINAIKNSANPNFPRLSRLRNERKANRELIQKLAGQILGTYSGNVFAGFILFYINDCIEFMLLPENREKFINDPQTSFTRNRLVTFKDLVYFLLTPGGDSLQGEAVDYFLLMMNIPSTSGTVQARQKLKPEAMEYIFREITGIFVEIFTSLNNEDIEIYAIDGTDAIIPNDEDDEETRIDGNSKRAGYNQNHINCLLDCTVLLFNDFVIQGKRKSNECASAIDLVKNATFNKPSLLTVDRGIPSLKLVYTVILKNNLDFLFRVKKSFITETDALPEEEFDIDIHLRVTKSQSKEAKALAVEGKAKILTRGWTLPGYTDIALRVIRFKLPANSQGEENWETLITSLPREKFSLKKVKILYHERWGIETCFRVLKYDINMSKLHSKSKEGIRQEYYARFAMFNICMAMMNICKYKYQNTLADQNQKQYGQQPEHPFDESDEEAKKAYKKQPNGQKRYEKTNKHVYAICKSKAINIIMAFFRYKGNVKWDIVEEITKFKECVRTGRSFKRKIKFKSAIYYFIYR